MMTRRGQSIAEYAIIMLVILAAVLAVGLQYRFKNAFQSFFDRTSGIIAGTRH